MSNTGKGQYYQMQESLKTDTCTEEKNERYAEVSENEILAFKGRLTKEDRKLWEEIEAGSRLPDLFYDVTFKRIFNPDIHRERFNRFIRLVFPEIPVVTGSLNSEMLKPSLYSKRTIMDIVAALENNSVCDLELQRVAQEFISTRTEIYASDITILQYSVNADRDGGKVSYADMPENYLVVIMVKSPSVFRDSPYVIHRKRIVTDTGIDLRFPVKIVYIEAEKCYNYYKRNGRYPKDCEELGPWLCAIADINYMRQKAADNSDIQSICSELKDFGKAKEAVMVLFEEKYAELDRNTELLEAERRGEKAGRKAGEVIGRKAGEVVGRKAGEKCGIERGLALAKSIIRYNAEGKSVHEIALLCRVEEKIVEDILLDE